jgi:hypothetical protein
MKKYFLVIVIIIINCNNLFSQTKPATVNVPNPITVESGLKITGFGKLKLGMDVKDLEELKEAKAMKTYNDFISKVYKNYSNNTVYEQIADTTKIERGFGSPDKKVRIFTVPKINVTDEIVLKFVELKFYDDKLYYIRCDYDKNLIDALTLKYGEPKVETKEEDKEFTYTYTGNKITKKERKFTSNWNTSDVNVICTSLMSNYFNSKGEESFLSYVNLYNKQTLIMISKSESDFFDKKKAKEEAEKKAKLSKF